MKKLTASIFASLLTVVGINAAHAEIASSKWVENQIEASEAEIKKTTDAIAKDVKDNADAIELKQDALKTTDDSHITIADDGTISTTGLQETLVFATDGHVGFDEDGKLTTTGLATESELNGVKTTAEDAADDAATAKSQAETNAGDITILKGDAQTAGSVQYQIADAVNNENGVVATAIASATDGLLSASDASETYATKNSVTELGTTVGENTTAIEEVKETAEAAIPAPTGECEDYGAKCVLTVTGTKDKPVYGWELIERGTSESNPDGEE